MNASIAARAEGGVLELPERDWQRADGSPLVMRVRAMTQIRLLGGAVAKAVRGGRQVVLQSVGVSATYQAVKALAVARTFLATDGMEIAVRVYFVSLPDLNGITGIEFRLEACRHRGYRVQP